MLKNLTNQTIALAGLNLAVQAVRSLARNGNADNDDLETCLSSLLKINTDTVLDVYGGLERLKGGLALLDKQLGPPDTVDTELARYAAALVYLEGKFRREAGMQKSVRAGLERVTAQVARFGIGHDEVTASLADLYQSNISRIGPKVMVAGNPYYFENPAIANRIRALLLAGLRSAWLWRQCGGSKLGFLLNRRKIREEAARLLRGLG